MALCLVRFDGGRGGGRREVGPAAVPGDTGLRTFGRGHPALRSPLDRVRRAIIAGDDSETVVGFADGTVVGWLPSDMSDFVSEFTKIAAPLWHIKVRPARNKRRTYAHCLRRGGGWECTTTCKNPAGEGFCGGGSTAASSVCGWAVVDLVYVVQYDSHDMGEEDLEEVEVDDAVTAWETKAWQNSQKSREVREYR